MSYINTIAFFACFCNINMLSYWYLQNTIEYWQSDVLWADAFPADERRMKLWRRTKVVGLWRSHACRLAITTGQTQLAVLFFRSPQIERWKHWHILTWKTYYQLFHESSWFFTGLAHTTSARASANQASFLKRRRSHQHQLWLSSARRRSIWKGSHLAGCKNGKANICHVFLQRSVFRSDYFFGSWGTSEFNGLPRSCFFFSFFSGLFHGAMKLRLPLVARPAVWRCQRLAH